MGTLDDAIREHLELKRRLGAPEDELEQKEKEAFGARSAPAPTPPPEPVAADAEPPEFQVQRTSPAEPRHSEGDTWAAPEADDLLEPDEVLPQDSLESNGSYAPPPPVERRARPEPESEAEGDAPGEDRSDEWEEEPAPTEDVLRETPEFLEETPEHDRLWFEQKPPKDLDFE
jgi:hypothetical protein